MTLITLKTFDNPVDAHLLKTKLESEDIPCFLFDENVVGINPLLNVTVGGIKLKINEQDYELAFKILSTVDVTVSNNPNLEILTCPHCNTTDVYEKNKQSQGVKATFVYVFREVFPFLLKESYTCKSCGELFKKVTS